MTDVLIRGVTIPQNCIDCMCYNTEFGYCQATEDDIESSFEAKPDKCPIVELPEHGDLIDRNELCDGLVSNHPVVIYAKTAPVVIPSNKEERNNETH